MRLDLMTWPQVEAYLRHSRTIVLPLGSLEQHGAAGMIGTDALCAGAIATRAAERAGMIAAPVLAYGQAQFNLGFPGTISLRPSTLSAVLFDAIVSLGRAGFARVLLLSGHGGNVAPALSAIQEVMAEVSIGRLAFPHPVTVKLRCWWEGSRVRRLRETLYGDREGFHATPSEIAIVLALHPDRSAPDAWPPYRALPADPLVDLGGDRHEDTARHRARYPDGPIGADPALARSEHGVQLLDAAVEDFAELLGEFAAAK
jgi:creatinine amidohydrolase